MNHMLSLAEIAGWQITSRPARSGLIVAALPALQRGAVWKVKQIEDLWDSILREFPIGAFVISPIDPRRGRQKFRFEQTGLPHATHHLLDGQQRATGIALGFADVWGTRPPVDEIRAACWIDLDNVPAGRDAEFVVRVQTRAHPWGYSRINPDTRLSQQKIRAAIQAFQALNPGYENSRPEELPLTLTWPWDSNAPVPLPILFAAVDTTDGDIGAAVQLAWQRVQQLPMFNTESRLEGQSVEEDDPALAAAKMHVEQCRHNLSSAFTDETSVLGIRLRDLMSRLTLLLRGESYRVPLLHLGLGDWGPYLAREGAKEDHTAEAEQTGNEKDPVELLFVRINSAGTPLAGEELIYSLLKSAWIDAPRFIETLRHKPAVPSRIAMLCIRLVQARLQRSSNSLNEEKRFIIPGAPSVDEFRRLMRGHSRSAFYDALLRYIQDEAAVTFERAWSFLTDSSKSFSLPHVVAAEIAQKSPDVFLLLLCWLDRLASLKCQASDVSPNQQRRALGFLTALAWFAKDKAKAVSLLWDKLQRLDEPDHLLEFFNRRHFALVCQLDQHSQTAMVPLIAADDLDLVCRKRITGYQGCQDTISRSDSAIWKEWNWYDSFVTPAANDLKAFYTEKLYHKKLDEAEREIDLPESARNACEHFLEVLWGCHPMLLFAQRKWLAQWFPNFNPALPEFLEDKNRPWDYDHIHPQSYLRSEYGNSLKGLPQLIKDWHGSVGNLRAWPLEINRSDGDSTPGLKFDSIARAEIRYEMSRPKHKLQASFVDEDEIYWWEQSLPSDVPRDYLKSPSHHEARKALIIAIVNRFIALYREWYETLRLKDFQ